MYYLLFVILLVSTETYSRNPSLLSDEEYRLLPAIFEMDNYAECGRNNLYCRAEINLISPNQSNHVWKLVEVSKKDPFLYNHDTIQRTICIPESQKRKSGSVKEYVQKYADRQVRHLNLTAAVKTITCNKFEEMSTWDYFAEIFVFSYIFITLWCSWYDYNLRKNSAVKNAADGNKYIISFSLLSNYEKIIKPIDNKDYKNLKSIQGLRTLNSILVVCAHTKLSFLASFVESTKYLEEMNYNFLYLFLILDYFIVQFFFLISAWLLTIEVLGIYDRNKQLGIKDTFLLFINRCFRIWPVLISVLMFQRKSLYQRFVYLPVPHLIDIPANACQTKWWAMLLFVQNFYDGKDACNLISWYISADMQLYAISLVILYVTVKFKSMYFLKFSLLVSYVLFAAIIYLKNLDVIFRPYVEYFRMANFMEETSFRYLYTMSYVHSTTYILGICFGVVYWKLKNRNIVNGKSFIAFWMVSFFTFPPLAIYIASKHFNRILAALIGPLLKPLYSFGIGMGILGMSMNTGGFVKKIYECRFFEVLSKFTYCVYIYHFIPVFTRSVSMQKPLKCSNTIMIVSALQDVIISFVMGFVAHILVELPWMSLQKLIIPQVKKNIHIANVKMDSKEK